MKKITKAELDLVLQDQEETLTEFPFLRKGQSFFNSLYLLYPEKANEIMATEYDPFYNDTIIEKCIKFITSEE